ncbi:MAG: hypothetical protein COB02_10690 [Candidatus Cloacimonadota bacterium]|nr:MAG: hypothetical protein COB02_10690 [Candidatus Cloacimonadota bacterium]
MKKTLNTKDLSTFFDVESNLKCILCTYGIENIGSFSIVPELNLDSLKEACLLWAKKSQLLVQLYNKNLAGGHLIISGPIDELSNLKLMSTFKKKVEDKYNIVINDANKYFTTIKSIKYKTDYKDLSRFIFEIILICLKKNKNKAKVAIQGLGQIGYELSRLCFEAKIQIIVSDISKQKVKKVVKNFNAIEVLSDDIYTINCDVFCPCAIGAVLNPLTISKLGCKFIVGAANHQLSDESVHLLLKEKNIIYIPDYIINSFQYINIKEKLLKVLEASLDRNIDMIQVLEGV